MPGDLGNLGSASFTSKNISRLLDVLVPTQSSAFAGKDNVLSENYKARLELTVRLLATAQRLHLSAAEWNAMEDPAEEIVSQFSERPAMNDYNSLSFGDDSDPNLCVPSSLAESPFIARILHHLYAVAPGSAVSAFSEETAGSQSQRTMLREDIPSSTFEQSPSNNPLLQSMAMSFGGLKMTKESEIVARLHILSASCELFPLGSCWASSANKWQRVSEDRSFSEPIHVETGSFADLAAVVKVVCAILEAHGGYHGSTEIQKWALICLNKLAIATDAHLAVLEGNVSEEEDLAEAWRQVWRILLQPTLSFSNLTKTFGLGTNGDLVMRLLTQIVRFACVDPAARHPTAVFRDSFLAKQQADLWRLPVFESCGIPFPSAFMLVYSVLQGCGLSDHGNDTIGRTMSQAGRDDWLSRLQQCGTGRRSKLLCYCLHSLEHSLEVWKNEELVAIIVACMSVLANGWTDVAPSVVFFGTAGNDLPVAGLLPGDFTFTRFFDYRGTFAGEGNGDLFCDVFSCLWRRPLPSPEELAPTSFPGVYDDFMDIVSRSLLFVQVHSRKAEEKRMSFHSISRSQSERLLREVYSSLGSLASYGLEKESDTNTETNVNGCIQNLRELHSIPLPTSSIFLRGFLTVALTSHHGALLRSFDNICSKVAKLCCSVSLNTTNSCGNKGDLPSALTDLIRVIRALVEVNSRLGIRWPNSLRNGFVELHNFCDEMLHLYTVGGVETVEPATPTVEKSQDLDISDGECDDTLPQRSGTREAPGKKRKPKQAKTNEKRKRSRSLSSQGASLTSECAYLLGYLMITLNPSFKDCNFVARQLFGGDIDDTTHTEYTVDPWGGMQAAAFICNEHILIGQKLLDNATLSADSPSSLVCRIVRAVRRSALPHSAAHLFGYSSCAKIVRIFDKHHGFVSLDSNEARIIIDLIADTDNNQDRRSLILRPRFQVARLEAAISTFRTSAECVHAAMDIDFGRIFVLPSLVDVNSEVRRQGRIAVAVTLPVLEEEKVIESVRKQLCPISTNADDSAYEEWYSRRKSLGFGGNTDTSTAIESQVWKDACVSLRFDVLQCWSTIAATTTTREALQQVFFDLVLIADGHRSLQGLAFQILEQIANSKGYATVEQMVDAEIRDFARRWLETGLCLFDLPLMICGPSTFRKLVWTGNLRRLCLNDGGGSENEELDGVRKIAATAFLRLYGCDFLPTIMVQTVTNMIQTSATKDGRRLLLENESLKQFCGAFDDRFNDDLAKMLIENHSPSLLAEVLALRNLSDENAVIADSMMQLIKGLLSDEHVEQLCFKASGLIVRRLLDLIGQSLDNGSHESFVDTLRTLVEACGKKPVKRGGDIYGQLGCTVIEVLLFARFRLSSSFTVQQMTLRWRSSRAILEVLLEQLRYHYDGDHLLDFPIHFLLGILSDPTMRPVRLLALQSLIEITEEMASGHASSPKTKYPIVGSIGSVFASVLDLHRSCQHDFLEICTRFQRRDEQLSRRSSTLVRNEEAVYISPSGSELSAILHKYRQCVNQDTIDCLSGTFDFIRILVDNRKLFGLSASVIRGLSKEKSESTLTGALGSLHKCYCAQEYIDGVVSETEAKEGVDPLALLNRLVSEASTSQSLVSATLAEIEVSLQQEDRTALNGQVSPFSTEHIKGLSQILLQLCSATSSTDETKLTASRCLGEICLELSKTHFDGLCDASVGDAELGVNVGGDNFPLRALQARTIEYLASSLQDSDPKRTMVAMDTLTALVSVRVGKDYCRMLEESETYALLRPFLNSSRASQSRISKLELDEAELEAMQESCAVQINGEYQLWCWDKALWQTGPETRFDDWICRLVPALIACKYGGQDKGSPDKIYFRKCQRLSCMDGKFARTIFPAIILDLLLSGVNSSPFKISRKDKVLSDTWIGSSEDDINIRLSASFDILFKCCANVADTQFVELALDVLDMLRRITQERFTASPNHRPNRPRELTEKVVPFRGVPYGTVLNLDGATVTNAFIQARRFEGALFYAELYADARFRGSTNAAKVLSLEPSERAKTLRSTSTPDVSGFSIHLSSTTDDITKASEHSSIERIENDCLTFMSALQTCFTNLGEHDCRKAVDSQASEFAFFSSDGALAATGASALERVEPSLNQLQKLDRMSMVDHRSGPLKLSVANCLEELGCHSTLGLYISGLKASEGGNVFDFEERSELREKWFTCRLFEMQWEGDSLFREDSGRFAAHVQSASAASRHYQPELPEGSEYPGEEAGFYEHMVHALVTLRTDDLEACRAHLQLSRLRFIDILAFTPATTMTLKDVADVARPLKVLNDLEDYAATANSDSAQTFLLRCATMPPLENFRSVGALDSVASCVQEITLQSLRSSSKMANLHKKITETLIDNFDKQFDVNLRAGRMHVADGILQRWYGVMKTMDQATSHQKSSLLHLRLKEAALFERNGDFLEAIRVAKLAARTVQDTEQSNLPHRSLYADALTLCGRWTANHKVEPAKDVLAKYLKKAAEVSQTIYANLSNDKNKDRYTEALLSQSELVFSLLESVSSRVSSTEWKRNEMISENQKKKLESLKPEYESAKALHEKSSRQTNKKLSISTAANYNKIAKAYLPLFKRCENAVAVRNDILSSMEEFRKLALDSIISALAIAGIGASEDRSKYVYRIFSIWSSIGNQTQWEGIDQIIEKAVNQIPSFRFVPLVTQIFSRIEQPESGVNSSESRLYQLVERMTREHPYHCIAPLITQSKITQAGSNSKAQAAVFLLDKLSKDDPMYIGELIKNYMTLFDAYSRLISNKKFDDDKTGRQIPLSEASKKSADHLDRCLGTGSRKVRLPPCVVTKPPLLRPKCDYGDKDGVSDPVGGERVAGFENHFTISASGISRPKIIGCIGTKGGHFKQLLKGDDDTRQDAVMEQVFVYVNGLLARQRSISGTSHRTNQKLLRVATYNVIPLDNKSGVRSLQAKPE